ncbi:MAG: glycosyltransferase family 4 protein [bacterium]
MNSRFHILVLTDFFFPDSMGGANKMSYYTAQGLVSRGHLVSVVTRRVREELKDYESLEGISIYRYDLHKKSLIDFAISAQPRIKNIFDSLRSHPPGLPDCVIVHQPLVAMAFRNHSIIKDLPWLYNFHSPWGEEFMISISHQGRNTSNPSLFLQHALRTWIEKSVLRRCQKIITLSQFMRERLKRIHNISRTSLIIPGCVNTDIFFPSTDQASLRRQLGLPLNKILLFTVRNLRPRMGLMNLVTSLSDLNSLREKVHLVIAGKGHLAEKLKTRAVKQKVSDLITFTGHVSEEDLPQYYQAADLFVLPTEYLEGFGMVTLEALATGLPVIGTPVGATPEILCHIGEEWLCRDSSSEALTSKITERIEWLLTNPKQFETTRKQCRHTALEHYALPRIIAQWERECRALLSHEGGKPY